MKRAYVSVFLSLAVITMASRADIIFDDFQVDQALDDINYNTELLERNIHSIPAHQHQIVRRNLTMLSRRLQRVADQLQSTPFPQPGGWYQADRQECVQFCRTVGLRSGLSPEGAQCVSGENQAQSAIGRISYSFGVWGGGPQSFLRSQSSGGYCYQPGQKVDNDRTDITVGCYCSR